MGKLFKQITLFLSCLIMGLGGAMAGSLPDFTRLVEENAPAVVNISTVSHGRQSYHQFHKPENMPIPENSPFNDLFRRFFDEEGRGEMPPEESESLGSGFIISTDGYVLTNHHVVDGADEVIVRLSNRKSYEAKVVGSDEASDIALLKIDAEDLPAVRIGNSKNLKIGAWVLAIGSPFGFDATVTAGIVSAKGRSLPSENYVPYIQTDVAINPGNSGGPLFNLDGEVVGINSQIFSQTGGYMGLSFAIPIDVAMNVINQLKTKGKVTRGWLGLLIQDVNRELAESFGMKQPRGAVVLKVMPDSPAARAGFKVGDVVVDFAGKSITRSSDLPLAVGRTPVGKTVRVKIIREGKPRTLTVKIAELPSEEQLAGKGVSPKPGTAKSGRLGLAVGALTEAQRKRLEVGDRGVLVRKVEKGPAREAGIRKNDVILMLNGKDVKNPEQFAKLVKSLPAGKSVPVLVQRGNAPVFLPLKVPEK